MDKELQRIKILEYLGWTELKRTRRRGDDGPVGALRGTSPDGVKGMIAPNPPNDLNAMHEAEKVLTKDQVYSYHELLTDATQPPRYSKISSDRWTWHVPAALRAEAFLRELDLWEDGKDGREGIVGDVAVPPTNESFMIIPNLVTEPHASEFSQWYETAKTERGLLDIKFCLGNHAQSSNESVFAEINSMLNAETLEDSEIF